MSKVVPIAECPDPSVHGSPFRYCPYCEWHEEPEPKTSITIPWPPSDALVDEVAKEMAFRVGAASHEPWRTDARAVLDVIGAVASDD